MENQKWKPLAKEWFFSSAESDFGLPRKYYESNTYFIALARVKLANAQKNPPDQTQ